jgi:bla regulator protein BlaR1
MNPAYLSSFANHIWQSTLFAGVAGLLTLALRKNHARVRHRVWLAAACKFLVPLSALIALGGHIQWRTAPEIAPSNLSFVMDEVSRPFMASAASSQLRATTPSAESSLPAVLWGIWACGFLGFACGWCIRWRRIRSAVRAASPVQLELSIRAMCSPTLLEPGVFGVFRPVLLLPQGIFERLTPAQLQAVIAHELCHIRYRDNLTAAIHMFVETVFWFHPLVWWIGKRMVDERERACDEEVLSLGSEPQVYAEGILNICKLYVESPLACVSGVTGSSFKPRIQAILANRKVDRVSFGKKAALAIVGTAALLLPVGIGMMKAPPVQAQSATTATEPKFEVASIKPCKSGDPNGGGISPGRLSSGCGLLVDAESMGPIQRAYVRFAGGHANPVRVLTIEGGPEWIRSEMFRIDARAEGNPNMEMMSGPMMQALLENRFKLKIHRETRQGPVYELTLGKNVSKLKPFQEGSCIPPPSGPRGPLPPGQKYCMHAVSPQGLVDTSGSTLTDFSGLLGLILDRQVIDKTGIAGSFDIHLAFSPDTLTSRPPRSVTDEPAVAADPNGPTVFTAIQEQLGLKLVPAKGPIDVLVIDHVERPSEN